MIHQNSIRATVNPNSAWPNSALQYELQQLPNYGTTPIQYPRFRMYSTHNYSDRPTSPCCSTSSHPRIVPAWPIFWHTKVHVQPPRRLVESITVSQKKKEEATSIGKLYLDTCLVSLRDDLFFVSESLHNLVGKSVPSPVVLSIF
jgi:hypothetical protein